MEHLSLDQARQEITIYNAIVRAGVLNEDCTESIDRALEEGFNKLN